MISWIKNIFKKEMNFKDYPKDSSWMLKENLEPNVKNLKKSEFFYNLIQVEENDDISKNAFNHLVLTGKEMYKLVSDSSWFLNERDKRILMLASILHNLGKQKDSTNYEIYSERITRNLLFNEDIEAREEICWLVRWNEIFYSILDKTKEEQIEIIQKLSQGYSTIEKLLLLHLADMRAKKETEENINSKLQKITSLAMSQDCYIKSSRDPKKTYDCIMYVMIGLPGSGKDTYINGFLKHLPCICRDDIREEITDGRVLGRKLYLDKIGELAVTNTVNERIKNCCCRKKDFVINQTSLKKKYRDDFKDIATKYADVKIVYIYIEAPSIDECIKRREGEKWINIINKMWEGFEFPDKSECDKLVLIKQEKPSRN